MLFYYEFLQPEIKTSPLTSLGLLSKQLREELTFMHLHRNCNYIDTYDYSNKSPPLFQ